jgi:hypothetical protein
VSVTARLEEATVDFLVALRSKDGFQQDLYNRLVDVLRECVPVWQDADSIPRSVVSLLVEIVPSAQASADLYPEPVRQRILDASFELYDLIMEGVGEAG